MKKLLAIATIATCAVSPVFAGVLDYVPTGLELGVGVSATSGLNGFIGYVNKTRESFWLKRIGVRADFATTKPLKSTINNAIDGAVSDIELGENGIRIDGGTFESKHIGALLDFYPFGNTWFLGGLRITGGYVSGDMKMTTNLSGEIDGLPDDKIAFELGGEKYYYEGNSVHGTAKLKWKYNGPYAGTGFDLGLFSGFKIYVDAGVVFTSKAAEVDADVPFTNLHKADGTPIDNDTLKSEVNNAKKEALKEAQDKLDEYKFFPMVKMGFMYRF